MRGICRVLRHGDWVLLLKNYDLVLVAQRQLACGFITSIQSVWCATRLRGQFGLMLDSVVTKGRVKWLEKPPTWQAEDSRADHQILQ